MASVSIILPTYNDADLLPAALENLYRQTRAANEIIVVNDGSTDETAVILNKHPRLTVLTHKTNRGTQAALKTGLDAARADYVLLTGSDDRPAPALIERSMSLLEVHPDAFMSVADFWLGRGDDLRPWGHALSNDARYLSPRAVGVGLRGVHLHGVGALYKRELLEPYGYLDPALGHHHDWFTSLVGAFRHGICVVPEHLAVLAVREKSWSQAGKDAWPVQRGILEHVFWKLAQPEFHDVVLHFVASRAMRHFEGAAERVLMENRQLMTRQNAALAGI